MTSEPTLPVGLAQAPGTQTPEPGKLDALFVVIVCVLAFLLASTPAQNSDLWLQLASGRLLARGQLAGRTDPFACTTTGVYWVNHGWLSDGLLFGLFTVGGGAALVFAKAVLATVLAGLFFCFRRRRARVGILALAGAASVVALGPWLVVRPVLWSLLGVGLTLFVLETQILVAGSRNPTSMRWLLLPLFALWANLDEWFLLGPVLVGLYTVGEGLRRLLRLGTSSPGELRSLALLTLGGLAACLANPYHYRVFAWPSLGLSHAEQVLMRDPIVSPFSARFTASPVFTSPGAWAYYLLLAAGLASFVLCRRALHPGRLLVWLCLAGLSIFQARTIPFFAVGGGILLALNYQEWATTTGTWLSGQRRLEDAVRRVAVLTGLLVLVLAWPGWLQPAPYQPRRWAVEPDGSLVRLAARLQQRHTEHEVRTDRRFFCFSIAVAHHMTWFCPTAKGFVDSRWPLFQASADDFVRIRECLLESNVPGSASAGDLNRSQRLAGLLDAHQIDRIILRDPDWARTARAYRSLLLSREWELLDLEGGAALFVRRVKKPGGQREADSALDSAFCPSRSALLRSAYHPEKKDRAPLTAPPAPSPAGLFDPFFRRSSNRSPDREEAALYLLDFDLRAERMQAELSRQWLLAIAAGLVGSMPGTASNSAWPTLAVSLGLTPVDSPVSPRQGKPQPAELFAAGFMALRDRGPPESLLLAVRAARRALSANPEDGGAALLLGEAYLRMARQTREQGWQRNLPLLGVIRKVQALTALQQAVASRPDLDQAHALLAQLYVEMGQMDRVLDHLRARLRISEQEARGGADAAVERRAQLSADVESMAGLVRRSEDIYQVNSADKQDPSQVLLRVNLALRYGLTRKALSMLQESSPVIFGKAGVKMQLELMMLAGQAAEVRDVLKAEPGEVLDFAEQHRLLASAAAACGDYAGADAEVEQMSEEMRRVRVAVDQTMPVRHALGLRVGEAALTRPTPGAGAAGLVSAVYLQARALAPLETLAGLLRREADASVLRGLIALEAGGVENASKHFHDALHLWDGGGGLDFPARGIAWYALHLLEEKEEGRQKSATTKHTNNTKEDRRTKRKTEEKVTAACATHLRSSCFPFFCLLGSSVFFRVVRVFRGGALLSLSSFLRVAVLIVVAALLVVAALRTGSERQPVPVLGDDPRRSYAGPYRNIDPDVGYVGDRQCAACHRAISASYARHPMGRSLTPAAAWGPPRQEDGRQANNPFTALDRRFEIVRHAQRLWHRQAVLDEPGKILAELSLEVHHVIGSGQKGYSFLSERDGYLFQTPISWFTQKQRWDLSPGFGPSALAGRAIPASCLFCHANQVREDPEQPDRLLPPVLAAGAIGCERCHGPGEQHVRARTAGEPAEGQTDYTIVNPKDLPTPLREAVCEQCHLEGEARILRSGRGLFDYRPGLPLHDFWSVQVSVQHSGADAKAVNHVEQMYQSKCFQRSVSSQGDPSRTLQLGCTTCHDPHVSIGRQQRDAHYRRACLKCHNPSTPAPLRGGRGCAVPVAQRRQTSPQDSCIECHMPRYTSSDIVHTASTDHRIVRHRRKGSGQLDAADPERSRFADFYRDRFPGGDPQAERNLGMGLVKMMTAGMLPPERSGAQAVRLLESALARYPRDAELRQSKALALVLLQRPTEALPELRAALAARPNDWRLLGYAAEAAKAVGQTEQAIDFWRKAVRINPFVPDHQVSLIGLLLRTGQMAEARDRCRKLLQLDPLNVSGRQARVGFLLEEGRKAEARSEFAVIRRLNPPDLAKREEWFAQRILP